MSASLLAGLRIVHGAACNPLPLQIKLSDGSRANDWCFLKVAIVFGPPDTASKPQHSHVEMVPSHNSHMIMSY